MTAKSSGITACTTVVEFFKDEVERACRTQNLQTSEEVSYYLVQLLEAFTKIDRIGVPLDEPFAILLERAVFSHPHRRVPAYRQLGDLSLYIAGVFAPSLRRRSVDVNYAIRMGAGAYATVSVLVRRGQAGYRSKTIHLLYAEMAEKFPNLVEVLTQICESNGFGCDSPDIVGLYERFTRTGSPQLLERLGRRGIWPGDLALSPEKTASDDDDGEPPLVIN